MTHFGVYKHDRDVHTAAAEILVFFLFAFFISRRLVALNESVNDIKQTGLNIINTTSLTSVNLVYWRH